PADVDALPDDVFPQDAVFVAQLEIPVDTVRAALRRASNKGMTVVFNPAPPVSGLADCVALVDVLVVNEHEASVILGENWGLESTEELESASDRLLQLGCRHVIVTLGERGYALRTAGLPMRLFPGVKVSAIDAVAAGDAFVGALAS